jgi:hypothetical protein
LLRFANWEVRDADHTFFPLILSLLPFLGSYILLMPVWQR